MTQNKEYEKSTEFVYDCAVEHDFVSAKEAIKKHKHKLAEIRYIFNTTKTSTEDTNYYIKRLFF